ncbi:hypothetical protein ALC57_05092 [Trachymyrmex cornetzi]|uniref:Uncharacterized protein n=1 Tax=Trachymyrmex cornetzi TaxID=471704 RepID=A0A151JC22_9HYME|nr:hypothetical protein ALC57_05092 [Trachymyrmex cornetzi]
MKHQKNREMTWTILELRGLLEDDDSHVHFVRTIKHITLHPYHLNNIQRGLNQILRLLLNTYDRDQGEIGWWSVNLDLQVTHKQKQRSKNITYLHWLHYSPIFLRAQKTCIVNKKNLDYIVILVHKIYTVSIPKPDNTEQWLGESVEIGQEIRCCVTQLHHKSKPPFICASLKSDYSQGCRLSESIINIDVDSAPESTNNYED